MRITESPANPLPPTGMARVDVRCPSCQVRAGSLVVTPSGEPWCSFCGTLFDMAKRSTWDLSAA